MDKNSAEILREIEAALASLKEQVRALEEQIAEYKELAAAEEAAALEEPVVSEVDFTDMEIGVADLPEEPAPVEKESVQEEIVEEQQLAVEMEDLPESEPVVEDLPEPEPMVEDLPETVPGPEPRPEVEPMPAPGPRPEPAPVAVPKVDTERMQWRLDKPGQTVKNIRSGISLYDRALFIGTLFKEDYALYDKTISDLNAMTGLDEAVDYLLASFPDWNLKSDIVYNFIMAVRKKLG